MAPQDLESDAPPPPAEEEGAPAPTTAKGPPQPVVGQERRAPRGRDRDERRRARPAEDPPLAEMPSNFTDAFMAGVERDDEAAQEYVKRLDHEEALARTAMAHPGSLLRSGVREPMLVGDYSSFWKAAVRVSDAMKASGKPIPDDGLDQDALLVELSDIDPARFQGPRGKKWFAKFLQRGAVGTEYALEVLVPTTVGRHQLAAFQRKTSELNARIKAGEPILQTHAEYMTAALQIARTPDGGRAVRELGLEIDDWEQDATQRAVVPLGIEILDRMMGGGPARGEMVVVGGGTNHGKSYFAEQLLHTHATDGSKILYLSIEDPKDLMVCRQLARHTDPPMAPVVIRGGKKGIDSKLYDEASFRAAKKKLSSETLGGRMYVAEHKKITVEEVCKLMRRYRYDKGVDAIIVDYLQAVRPDEDRMTNNRVQDTANAVADLKRCATDIGVVLYLLSQYARDQYKEGTEPDIQACKYAGDIENEAEVMILFWRDSQDVLHAKMPKIKWTSSKPKFFVRTHKTTGVFLDWEVDFNQGGGQGQGQGGGGQRGGGGGGYGGRGGGGGRSQGPVRGL